MSGKHILQVSAKAIVFSSFYISLSAVTMTLSSCLILTSHFSINLSLLCLVFFSTLLIYNLPIIDFKTSRNDFSLREKWKSENKVSLLVICLLSLLGVCYAATYFSISTILYLFHLAILAISYVKTIRIGGRYYSLRNFPFLKIIVLSYVWASVTVILPAMELNNTLHSRVLLLFVERFVFIMAISIPFDVRDYFKDKQEGIVTIPNSIGIQSSIWIAKILLFFFVLLSICFYGYSYVTLTRLICAIIAYIFIDKTNEKQNDFFYLAGIDGLMILHFVILSLMKFLIHF